MIDAPAVLPLRLPHRPPVPPFLLAPMAGITHSAFRRLVATLGGCGVLFTEMVPIHTALSENLTESPFFKRRPGEEPIACQLLASTKGTLERAVQRLTSIDPFCIDVNLGCPAPMVAKKGGGRALFDDLPRLEKTLRTIRSLWSGPLSVKCRLGHESPHWRELFVERVHCFKACGVDALTIHPRFFHEKLKRRARWELFPWVKSHWELPLVGNGDLRDRTALDLLKSGHCDALMIGREAIRRPWFFNVLAGREETVDYWKIWKLLHDYTLEDFPPERAIGRIKEFTTWYADNFLFGHDLYRFVQSAPDLATLYRRAEAFLAADPKCLRR